MSDAIVKVEVSQPKSRLSAFVELTKMRITIMVLMTFACMAFLSAVLTSVTIPIDVFLFGLLGMALIAASGNAMNMYLERYSDFRMPRTANRPLPAQNLTSTEVTIFVAASLGIGLSILLGCVNWQTSVCGAVNWILYVYVYTPLKKVTPWNTDIGAVAGAMPVIMGSLAMTGTVDLVGYSFFGVLFFWQFPHFYAIAWKYRDQYKQGGLKMLTVTEPTGLAAGIKSVITGVLLIVVSLLPVLKLPSLALAIVFSIIVVAIGIFYLVPAIHFCRQRNEQTAKRLLHASLLYLPIYMLVLMVIFLL